ncbi:MAG: L,D-transpeptidase [Salaquimonas sp.]
MRKLLMAGLAGSVLSFSILSPALAETRYKAPPPTVLSSDLASPWILQLRNNQAFQMRAQRNIELHQQMMRNLKKKSKIQRISLIRPAIQPSPQPTPKPAQSDGLDAKFLPQLVAYNGKHAPGTIVIDTSQRFLFLVEANGMARRYGVGVGKAGFEWSGTEKITRRAEWPDWRPPAEMRERERKKGRDLPVVMAGGPENPLGARALYLGSTLYRIHGTNRPDTIGKAMSSGCIRMRNEDVTDLYERVKVGTKVVVL